MILKLLEQYKNESFGDNRLRVVWEQVLPKDMSRLISNEQLLIQSGIHSRRRAMDEVGVTDPEMEFNQWLKERETILKMNKELNAGPGRAGARVRAAETPAESLEDTSP